MGTSAGAGGRPMAEMVEPADLLRALFDEAPDGVLLTDASGTVLAANERAAAITGRPIVGLIGATLLDLLSPAQPGVAPPRLDELCRAAPEVAECVLHCGGGRDVDAEVTCRNLPGGRRLWFVRDVSARRRREADAWIRGEAVESSINGIALAGLDGRIFHVNRAFLRMWGLASQEEAIGRLVESFWADPERARAILAIALGGDGTVGDLVGLRRDGERFFAEISSSLVRDVAGRPVALMASFLDTSARMRAAEALRVSEERLGQAMRVAEFGIFDNDLRARVVHWSPRMREIFDMSPDEEVSMAKMLARVHPDDRAAVEEAIARAETPQGDGRYDVDCRLVRRDGAVRFVSVRARTYFEGEGPGRRAVRRLGACRDVTEAAVATAERERLRTQLEHAQRLESVGRLAGGVAHDFNNMLAVILGNAELMRARPGLAPELDADLSEIERAAQHARDVTRQLLAFSRKQEVSPRSLDLNEELERTRKTLSRLIGEDVQVSLHLAPDLWRVSLDSVQVDQVLMNLAVNARDAMPGGGRLTIETANVQLDQVSGRRHPEVGPGDHVLLAVSDTGVGMDRETVRRVFEPFFTTKGPGKGTGLGLATVYGIVAQAGGTILVDSEPGRGSTFRIYFPRYLGPGPAAQDTGPAPAVPGGGTVLLVEDDDMVRRMAASMLASLGLAVVPAGTPGEALSIVERGDRDIALVLTDVVMPEMNGPALRDRLRRLRPDLPVIFMSGYTADAGVHRSSLDEGLHHLQKPFTLDELASAVSGALGAARAGAGEP